MPALTIEEIDEALLEAVSKDNARILRGEGDDEMPDTQDSYRTPE